MGNFIRLACPCPKFDFPPRFPYVPLNSVRRLNDLAPLYAMKP